MSNCLKSRSWLFAGPISAPSIEPAAACADRIVVDPGIVDSRQVPDALWRRWTKHLSIDTLALQISSHPAAQFETHAELAIRLGVSAVLLAGARNGAEVQRLDVLLRTAEICHGREPGGIGIIALADSAGILAAASFQRCSHRLLALGWQIDCAPGSETGKLARATISLAAHAAGVPAIDAMSSAVEETDFQAECVAARQNGFAGKLCRNAVEVAIANRVFPDQPPAPAGRFISNMSEPPSA